MIHEGQRSFRSQVAYVNLLAVLVISTLIIVIWSSPVAAVVFAALGVVWVALTLHSAIEVTDDGFKVCGLLRTRRLTWSEVDAFIVVGFSGSNRRMLRSMDDYLTSTTGGPNVVGVSLEAISKEALSARVPLFSVVVAVTSHGERLRVHGTASTPFDPTFPADTAAALNRTLTQHNAAATAA